MSSPVIPPQHRTVSGSKLIDKLAESLVAIKEEDGLTDAELGKFLHKGVDAGKAYRTGFAEMPFTSFLRGCERWNGRFANGVMSLVGMKVVPLHTGTVSDQALPTLLAKLMLEWSQAMEHGHVNDVALQRMKRTLIETGEAIDAMRERAA